MKRYFTAAAFAAFLASLSTPTLAMAAGDQSWSGTISDKMCGPDHKAMQSKQSDRDCTLACSKEGTPYVLVSGGNVYQLSGHDADLKTHAGHSVTISGELKGGTIRVSKVEMK
jgi:hypothetical protein